MRGTTRAGPAFQKFQRYRYSALVTCPMLIPPSHSATDSKPLLNTIADTHKTKGAHHLICPVFPSCLELILCRNRIQSNPINHVRVIAQRDRFDSFGRSGAKEVSVDRSLVDAALNCISFIVRTSGNNDEKFVSSTARSNDDFQLDIAGLRHAANYCNNNTSLDNSHVNSSRSRLYDHHRLAITANSNRIPQKVTKDIGPLSLCY